jgi:SanA protein
VTRRVVLLAVAVGVGGVLAAVGANLVVLGAAGDRVRERPEQLPRAQAALVLGARVFPGGRLSVMLEDRVRSAAELYHAGRVGKVLVSGDNGRAHYNEVNAMRDRLLELGVPAGDVFCDHAGFDTWSSAVRARKVFGASSVIVVTQRFHLPRAVYLADQAGLEATGYVADRRSYGRPGDRAARREWAARVKAVGEATVNRPPRFLGAPIPIQGDGRASWDDLIND